MNDLKFRAYDNKAKEWLLGYEYPNLGGFSMFGECMLMGEWSAIVNRFILQQRDRTPEDLIVMQWSTLMDKNKREIYEGDIVAVQMDYPDAEWHGLHVVEKRNGQFGVVGGKPRGFRTGAIMNYYPFNVEVVGNILENMEKVAWYETHGLLV